MASTISDKNPAADLQRLSQNLAQEAQALMANNEIKAQEKIHSIRLYLKKMRSLFHLVDPKTNRKAFKKLLKRLSTCRKELTPFRDEQVIQEIIVDMQKKQPDPTVKNSLSKIKTIVSKNNHLPEKKLLPLLEAASKTLAESNAFLASLPLTSWHPLGSGLKRTYKKARKGFSQLHHHPQYNSFHKWRRFVKELYFQMDFIFPQNPKNIKNVQDHLHSIEKNLGHDHDLHLLAGYIEGEKEKLPKTLPYKDLLKSMKKRGKNLRKKSLKRAALVFRPKTKRWTRQVEKSYQQATVGTH